MEYSIFKGTTGEVVDSGPVLTPNGLSVKALGFSSGTQPDVSVFIFVGNAASEDVNDMSLYEPLILNGEGIKLNAETPTYGFPQCGILRFTSEGVPLNKDLTLSATGNYRGGLPPSPFDGIGALVYKGNLDATGSGDQVAGAQVGWFYVVSVAGTFLGTPVAVGDEVFCKLTVVGTPTNLNNFEIIPSQVGILRTSDIINNLASTHPDKVLSAAQGPVIESAITAVHDENRLFFNTEEAATAFNYDTLDKPTEPKIVHIYETGTNDRNLYFYLPGPIATITGTSPILKVTKGTAEAGALIRFDAIKRACSSTELTNFLAFSTILPNNWTIEPQSTDNSLQLLWQNQKWPILIRNMVTNLINANTAKIVNVVDPTDAQDAATKKYVDNKLASAFSYFTVWAEENTQTISGAFEWSFGNGAEAPRNSGIVLMKACKLISLGLTVYEETGASYALNVDCYKNSAKASSEADIETPASSTGVTNSTYDLTTPVTFSAGDRVNFRTISSSGTVSQARVSALFRTALA